MYEKLANRPCHFGLFLTITIPLLVVRLRTRRKPCKNPELLYMPQGRNSKSNTNNIAREDEGIHFLNMVNPSVLMSLVAILALFLAFHTQSAFTHMIVIYRGMWLIIVYIYLLG